MLQLITGGGPLCRQNIWGECRRELPGLSKLCRRAPNQALSLSQAEAAVFGLHLRRGLRGRGAFVCNKPQKCNLCFHSSAWLITGPHAKAVTSVGSRLPLGKEERECTDFNACACLTARASGCVGGTESKVRRICTVRDAAVGCD